MAVTKTTTQADGDDEPLAASNIVKVSETHNANGDSIATDGVSIPVDEKRIPGPNEVRPQPGANDVKPQPDTNEVKSEPASVSGPGDIQKLLGELETVLPDLVTAVRTKSASFGDLAVAYSGKEGWEDTVNQVNYARIYPLVRKAFEFAQGELIDFCPSEKDIWVAITKPRKSRWPNRWQKADFSFLYNLGSSPVGTDTILRINQLAYDARRILDPKELDQCLRELYSATTDLIGIIEKHSKKTEPKTEQAKIADVGLNLDELEKRYLQVKAQLLYFAGVIFGTASAVIGILFLSTLAGFESVGVVATTLAAIGATISVVQKMSDEALTIKYDVGQFYIMLRGFTRPIIGSFAALLLLLAIKAELIPLSKTGAAEAAYLLLAGFAIGWAERAIPDIFTRAGFRGGLPPATKASGTSSS
jgi:hypothetical protein